MKYSRYAPFGRVYSSATKFPQGSIEDRIAKSITAQLNNGAVCALMYKYPGSTAFTDIREWNSDTSYRSVAPERSAAGADTRFLVTGQARPSPEFNVVVKPTQAEILAIYDGKLVGQFADGEIFKIPEAEDTGAIPVIDVEDPKQFFYYVPAFLERLAKDEKFFQRTPSFIAMKKGDMPSFVFWQRDLKPAHYLHSSNEPVVHAQALGPRTAAPQIASKYPMPKGLTQGNRGVRSRAPSPSEHPTALAVDTEGLAHLSEKVDAEAGPQWEVFDPRLEEDPIEFLDYYNTRLHGWHGYRSRMMLREVDIERVNYISPCLAHNHKERTKDSTSKTITAATVTPSPPQKIVETAMEIDAATGSLPKASDAPSKPWVQPGPIGKDDPAWKRFNEKQAERRIIRDARIRPEPVFTLEYCNPSGAKKIDTNKAILRRDFYDKLYERACIANRAAEGLSKCCLACGLKWINCTGSRQDHYNQHREERRLWSSLKGQTILVEPAMRVESLDPSKVSFVRNVPDLNWFRDLEETTLNLENELLEREHTCLVCDEHLDPADNNIAMHYNGHENERMYLREFYYKSPESLDSPTVVTTAEGSFQVPSQNISPPARPVQRFSMGLPFALRHEESLRIAHEKKALLEKLSNNMIAAGKEIKRTGEIPPSLNPLSIVQPKEAETKQKQANDVMDVTEVGPTHSDVIGNTTAKPAFTPWQKLPTTTSAKDGNSIDFIDKYSDAPVAGEVIQVSSDSESEAWQMVSPVQAQSSTRKESFSLADTYLQVDTHCRTLGVISDIVVEAKNIVKAAEDSKSFKSYSSKVVAAGALFYACALNGNRHSLDEICKIVGANFKETSRACYLLMFLVESDLGAELPRATREILKPVDDDSTLHYAPPQDDVDVDHDMDDMVHDPVFWSSESEHDQPEAVITAIRHKSGELYELGGSGDAADEIASSADADVPNEFEVESPQAEEEQTISDLPMGADLDEDEDGLDVNEIVDDVITKGPMMSAEMASDVMNLVTLLVEQVRETPGEFDTGESTVKESIERMASDYVGIQIAKASSPKASRSSRSARSQQSASAPISAQAPSEVATELTAAVEEESSDDDVCNVSIVPVMNDGLDITPNDLDVLDSLDEAFDWGCSANGLLLLSSNANQECINLIEAYRATGKTPTSHAKRSIINKIQAFIKDGIKQEKRLTPKKHRQGPGSQSAGPAASASQSKRSTEAATSRTPVTSASSRHAQRQPDISNLTTSLWYMSSESDNEKKLKRKRPAELPITPMSNRKRKGSRTSDPSFRPGPPTPFNPDEVSPRLPKMPRKSTDPLYRPGSALLDPTTPPVTPKHTSAHKATNRAAAKAEKKSSAKVEKTKKTNSVEAEPLIVSTRKNGVLKGSIKSPKTSPKKTSSKAALAATSEDITSEERPKRKAAIEATKSFGKTKIVD